MKKLYLNPDEKYVRKIVDGIIKSDFHCPCKLEHSMETKCNFTSLPLPNEISENTLCIDGQNDNGTCHCQLYKEVI